MNLFVREYNWMWQRLGLSLAECRVYAYIHGLTHGDKGGYDGSKRHLAELLGLDEKSVRNVLNALTEKNLILCTDGLWHSAELVRSSGADSVRENAETLRENADSVRSPHTPLYNNIKDKNKQADMQTDFEKFWNFFSPAPEFQNRRAATEMIFEARSLPARKAILLAAQNGAHQSPPNPQANPYFFVQDFPEPKPHNYNGDPRIDELLRAHQVAPAEYNGKFGMYSLEDIELFHLRRPGASSR